MLTCLCGGEVILVLTQEDDGSETLGPECWACGTDFSDLEEEITIEGDEIEVTKRWPMMTPSPSAE